MIDRLLTQLILLSQHTPFRGRGGYSSIPASEQAQATSLDKARAEAADFQRFFSYFPDSSLSGQLRDRIVLDFGSGYGGRTVEYALKYGPQMVCGVEPVQAHVEAGQSLALERGATQVEFRVNSQRGIPYQDETFDIVVTFDVLEHVDDPKAMLSELRRVVKPGGQMFAVFPVYRGMFAHHLDYITLLPALHLIFSPHRIMRVVNGLLDGPLSHIVVTRHAGAHESYCGRVVLPMLNGMGLNDFEAALGDGWKIERLQKNSVLDVFLGPQHWAAKLMRPLLRLPGFISEIFCFNVACVLRRTS